VLWAVRCERGFLLWNLFNIETPHDSIFLDYQNILPRVLAKIFKIVLNSDIKIYAWDTYIHCDALFSCFSLRWSVFFLRGTWYWPGYISFGYSTWYR
jgi:hypothetical protein